MHTRAVPERKNGRKDCDFTSRFRDVLYLKKKKKKYRPAVESDPRLWKWFATRLWLLALDSDLVSRRRDRRFREVASRRKIMRARFYRNKIIFNFIKMKRVTQRRGRDFRFLLTFNWNRSCLNCFQFFCFFEFHDILIKILHMPHYIDIYINFELEFY